MSSLTEFEGKKKKKKPHPQKQVPDPMVWERKKEIELT